MNLCIYVYSLSRGNCIDAILNSSCTLLNSPKPCRRPRVPRRWPIAAGAAAPRRFISFNVYSTRSNSHSTLVQHLGQYTHTHIDIYIYISGLADNNVHRTSNRRWKILAFEHNKTFTEHEHEHTVQRSTVERTSNTTFTSLARTERRTQQHLRKHRTEQRTSRKFLKQKSEYNQNSISITNRTSYTTSLLCEQKIQHKRAFFYSLG